MWRRLGGFAEKDFLLWLLDLNGFGAVVWLFKFIKDVPHVADQPGAQKTIHSETCQLVGMSVETKSAARSSFGFKF